MKKVIVIILVAHFLMGYSIKEKIERYSGKNSHSLIKLYEEIKDDGIKGELLEFILKNSTPNDIGVFTPDYLLENIDLALEARKLPFNSFYSDEIFKHFVVPSRISQEPIENYRGSFFKELKETTKDVENIEEAIILVNLWVHEKMFFKYTIGRDQGPLTCIKHGWGRCEEFMILFIAGARSIGIPARPASAPFWNFTDNNHAWVEVYTEDGWSYLGDDNQLNRSWFTYTTRRATLVTSRAFGEYSSDETISSSNGGTLLSSIKNYTYDKRSTIEVVDISNSGVDSAKVTIYGVSYGGYFPMISVYSNGDGEVEIPLGAGTVFVTASKDSLITGSLFSLMDNSSLKLKLTLKESSLDDSYSTFLFPLPEEIEKKFPQKNKHFEENYRMMKRLSTLTRNDKINNQKRSKKFLQFYDKVYRDRSYDERVSFLDKCDNLCYSSSDYLTVFKHIQNDTLKTKILIDMILSSSTKDNAEIPDSLKIEELVNIYSSGYNQLGSQYPDSMLYSHIIDGGSYSTRIPKNGWEWDLYKNHLIPLIGDEIATTVDNLKRFVAETVTLDKDYIHTYFSGAINPVEMINIKHLPKGYINQIIYQSLRLLGIPVRWEGRIEYYDGEKFQPYDSEKGLEELTESKPSYLVKIKVDNEIVKAEPFKNFLLISDEGGSLYYSYFDGEESGDSFNLNFLKKDGVNYYLNGAVRNSNGDADVALIKIDDRFDKEITINLSTPKEHLDMSKYFSENSINGVKEFGSNYEGKRIIVVRAEEISEPEIRMVDHILKKADNILKNGANLIFYSENRDNSDLKERRGDLTLVTGEPFIDDIAKEDYPLIFILDEDDEMTFSFKGYNMGIGKLLEQRSKK